MCSPKRLRGDSRVRRPVAQRGAQEIGEGAWYRIPPVPTQAPWQMRAAWDSHLLSSAFTARARERIVFFFAPFATPGPTLSWPLSLSVLRV